MTRNDHHWRGADIKPNPDKVGRGSNTAGLSDGA